MRTEKTKVEIEGDSVLGFWNARASDFHNSSKHSSMLYGDEQAAKIRSETEISLVLPLLELNDNNSVLDVGCGIGRWADALKGQIGLYVGTDFSPELIKIANQRFRDLNEFRFLNLSAQESNKSNLGVGFDTVLIAGVLHYLNDVDVKKVLENVLSITLPGARVYVRGPFANRKRLSLVNEWSEHLGSNYNAIYRTQEEFHQLVQEVDTQEVLNLEKEGRPFGEEERKFPETEQKFFLWRKSI